MQDPAKPLINRAVQGQFAPGSTFKVAVAAGALEAGVANVRSGVSCGGGTQFGNHYFRCWRKGGHGSVNLHEAIVQSCDVFFYQFGPAARDRRDGALRAEPRPRRAERRRARPREGRTIPTASGR
jgi:cell division protein FtsI/penicillin-binding protein 2